MIQEHWRILSLDIGHPLQGIPALDQGAGILAQIWKGSLPLGQIWIEAGLLPMTPHELAERIAAAIAPAVGNRIFPGGFPPRLSDERTAFLRGAPIVPSALLGTTNPVAALSPPPGNASPPSVSVLVCTRNRPEALERCLASLTRLDPAADEILVVDNAPSNPRARDVVKGFPGVLWIPELKPGLSRARNAGLRMARRDILAWTDDDVTAHPGWVGALRKTLSDPALSAVTGLVLAGELETAAQVHFERDRGGLQRGFRAFTMDADFFDRTRDIGSPVWQAGAGANMAFRREVFERLGPFDERLGAGAWGCSEDSEFLYRMLAAGMSIRYEPAAVVWHHHRATGKELQAQMEDYMRGHVAALLVQFEKHGHRGNLHRVFHALPRYYLALLRQRLAGVPHGTLLAEIRGCLRGLICYLRHRP